MDSKKSLEAVLLGGALIVTLGSAVVPLQANAATICNLDTDGTGSAVTGNESSFVKVDFTAKCSPNTVVKYSQSNSAFAAQGGSKKGNTLYGSSSEGGGGARACNTSSYTDAAGAVADPASDALDGCA